MKRVFIAFALTVGLVGSMYAQTRTTPTERWYDHLENTLGAPADTLVGIQRNKIHPQDLFMVTFIAINKERAFFIESETTNQFDYGGSRIFLGTDFETAKKTLGDFHAMLFQPSGTSDTLRNDGYTLYIRVEDNPTKGRVLVTQRIHDGGTVTFNEEMFWMLEDAMSEYDPNTSTTFLHRHFDTREEIESAIEKYTLRNTKSCIRRTIRQKPNAPLYTHGFSELFEKRMKEYKSDLRRIKRK